MSRRVLRLLFAVSLVAGLVPAAALQAAEADAPAVHSPNMSHVANIAYEARYQARANRGTDLEFTELTLPGDAVEELAKRDGNVEDGNAELEGIQRTYSLAGSYDNGLHLIDVTDPNDAFIAGIYDCGISQGDVQVFRRDDGTGLVRTYATFTWDTGYAGRAASTCFQEADALGQKANDEGTFIADITNPYEPVTVSYVKVPKGSHNATVHPSGEFLYNSNSDLITSVAGERVGIEVYDIRDFANPAEVAFIPISPRPGLGTESHDITFNASGTRAYSAALSQGLIIDTSDPGNPELLTSFLDPEINVWHQSDPVTITHPVLGKRDFLLVEDEVAGATGTGQCPNGGVHVYDITGPLELAPAKVGYWNIADARVFSTSLSCTAHVFDIHESEALMTISYYQGGVRVVDLSNLVGVALGANGPGMKELAFFYFADEGGTQGGVDPGASNSWSFKAPFVDRDGVFYGYSDDQNRGFDIFKVDLTNPANASKNPGIWLKPGELAAKLGARPAAFTRDNAPYCLLRNL